MFSITQRRLEKVNNKLIALNVLLVDNDNEDNFNRENKGNLLIITDAEK